jgi:hypothetical protein
VSKLSGSRAAALQPFALNLSKGRKPNLESAITALRQAQHKRQVELRNVPGSDLQIHKPADLLPILLRTSILHRNFFGWRARS